MNNKRNNRYKSRGSILVITALAAIVWIFIAQSLFIVGAGGFGMIKSSRVALQAQQYAEIEVDRLKNVAYENLDSNGAHSRQAIANIQESGWEDEVSIGSEHAISGSDDAKQRIATINVYKSGDTLPRFTLEVPLSSQSSSLDLPVGTILPYTGKLSDIPSGWYLCDGSNGTPDLRDRFLTGVGSSYSLGDTGGENFHRLTITEMPSHTHGVPIGNDYNGYGGPPDSGRNGVSGYLNSLSSGGDMPHENRPPYYAVYYIMRVK